jgi:predicted kinase
MPTLILMMGPPGSGKSTYRKTALPSAHVISPDDVLTEWGGGTYDWSPRKASAAWRNADGQLEYEILAHAEGEDYKADVYVFDAVFQKPKRRKKYIKMAKEAGWTVEAVYVKTPINVCLKRNAERPPNRMVPEEQLLKMAKQMTAPSMAEGFDKVRVVAGV